MPQKEEPTINRVYKPSDAEQKIRRRVYERYEAMKTAPERTKMEKEWTDGEKAWDAFRSEKNAEDWNSNYYIPLTTSVVESVLAEFVDQRLRPLILPNSPEDQSRARVMSHIYDFTWNVANGDWEMYDILKGALIRGTSIAQEYYLKDRRLVKDVIEFSHIKKKKTTEFSTKEREVFEFDGCLMEYVNLWDFFIDEKARDINWGPYKARDCIRRYVMSYDDAKRFFNGPMWNQLNNFQYVKAGRGDTNYWQFYKPPTGVDMSDDVEVLWYWSRSPEDQLVIVINDVVIVNCPNIFRHKQLPFGRAVDIKRLDRFYGRGEPKLLESIQEELNTLRRMTIDRHHLDLDKSFLVGQNTMLDDEDLIARPHALIPVDDPKNVKALEYGDIPSSVRTTQAAIFEDSIRVTGVDDRFQALQKSPSTATEAAILKESTLKRIRMKIMLLTEGFMKDIARQRVSNIIQFYAQPKLEKIVGDQMTAEMRAQMDQAARDGQLEIRGGEAYKKSYRQIRLKDRELSFDERGNLVERDKRGFSFFELDPKYFVPIAEGGFDIQFEAGSVLPISKPLLQSKFTEMYDRLVPVAQVAGISLPKLTDEYIKINDMNPQDFRESSEQSGEMVSEDRIEMAIQLANQENQQAAQGKPIPERGTPYAPPVHSEVHVAFLNSPIAKQMGEDAYKALVKHTMGELIAQQMRASGGAGSEQINGQQPGQENAMRNIMPDRVQGGGDVQNGQPQPTQTINQ